MHINTFSIPFLNIRACKALTLLIYKAQYFYFYFYCCIVFLMGNNRCLIMYDKSKDIALSNPVPYFSF